jgi:hypothetical protein
MIFSSEQRPTVRLPPFPAAPSLARLSGVHGATPAPADGGARGRMHAQVVAANPGLKFGDIAKLLGQKWKAMSDAEKAPYKAKETQVPAPAPAQPPAQPPGRVLHGRARRPTRGRVLTRGRAVGQLKAEFEAKQELE